MPISKARDWSRLKSAHIWEHFCFSRSLSCAPRSLSDHSRPEPAGIQKIHACLHLQFNARNSFSRIRVKSRHFFIVRSDAVPLVLLYYSQLLLRRRSISRVKLTSKVKGNQPTGIQNGGSRYLAFSENCGVRGWDAPNTMGRKWEKGTSELQGELTPTGLY